MKIDLHHVLTWLGAAGLIGTSIADQFGHQSHIGLIAAGIVTVAGTVQRAIQAYEAANPAPPAAPSQTKT